ncbi:hypothetical protein Taro_035638 [Colocasia esculenta]|uniref:BHLH domain-containing protein n=1 Tax=Colocasia esculenta TaxID=4460 RepID=A0A843W793_COLES|nr:hypothetical protein [Colocasia esculenta]
MDDYLDPFLSSSSSSPWEDAHLSQRLSWVDTAASQANGLLADPVVVYQDDSNLHMPVIDSNNIMGTMTRCQSAVSVNDATSSIFVDGNLIHGLNKLPGEDELQQDVQKRLSVSSQNESEGSERSFSLQEVIDSNQFSTSLGAELNNSCTRTMPPTTLTENGSIESNDNDISPFPQSVRDSHPTPMVQELWPSSYSGSHLLFVGDGKLEDLGLQGKGIGTDVNILGNPYIDYGKLQQMETLATALRDHSKLQSFHLPPFASGRQIKLPESIGVQPRQQGAFTGCTGLQGPQQLLQSGEGNAISHFTNHSPNQSQVSPANAAGSNGIAKARVRARRGQATDPHSIAERLRREKIAERMKNLQELVPNSTKTDKASMLDEIIDYVKFLQLQVKVLSMSRLGAAGAVVPLITDIPAEESSSLLLGPEGYLQESQDNLALEQEVVKLMESNVTMAMQYLQNKGLCLMPVALAAAISGRKGSSSVLPPDNRKTDANLGAIPHCNESTLQQGNVRGDSKNCKGVAIKQEEAKRCASDTGNLKPKA